MNIINPQNNGGGPDNPVFNLEERYDKEITPLIADLCEKAGKLGLPIFIVACYKSDGMGAWLASSARSRGDFVPREFHIIRAVVEGAAKIVELG